MTKKIAVKYVPLLKFLTQKKISRKCFKSLIQSLDEKAIKFLCECIQNAISIKYISRLNGKKKSSFLKSILPNKKILKHLCKKCTNYKGHRKIIAQKGYGFILPVLSAIVPLITSLLAQR